MNKLLIALAVALVTPLAAIADQTTLGVPDAGCQTPAQWRTHDYGAPAVGLVGPAVNGNATPCNPNPTTPSWDGDAEFALGGAHLVSRSGDGVTSGGLACYDTFGHHPEGGVVTVTDLSGTPVAFSVFADHSRAPPASGPDCGDNLVEPCDPMPPQPSALPQPVGGVVDFLNALRYNVFGPGGDGTTCNLKDQRVDCLDSCAVPFAPGPDGSYLVAVYPTADANHGLPTLATQGHVDL